MFVADGAVFGAHCALVWGTNQRSTVTIYVGPEDQQAGDSFGTMAYALPQAQTGKTIATVLISTNNQAQIELATQTAQMLAITLGRPVFANASIGGSNVMLLRSIRDFVESEMAGAKR